MYFSLFYLPVLRLNTTPRQVYDQILAEIVEADALGWDAVWFAEHHFDPYGGIVPSPMLFGAAVAAATRRIRLGPGVALLPLRNGLQLAEECAMLDVLSQGRVNIGIGRGFMPHEFDSFGVGTAGRQERFEETLQVLLAALRQERFSFSGSFYQIKAAQLYPAPLQQPYPPIWMAASLSPRSFELAGQYGFNLMLNPYTRTTEELERGLDWYRTALVRHGHDPAQQRILVHHHLYVAPDEARAREEPRQALLAYLGEVDRAYAKGNPAATKLAPPTYELMYPDRVMFGTPDLIEDKIRVWSRLGVTDFCFMSQFGDLALERSLASLRLFSEQVMPRLRAGHAAVRA